MNIQANIVEPPAHVGLGSIASRPKGCAAPATSVVPRKRRSTADFRSGCVVPGHRAIRSRRPFARIPLKCSKRHRMLTRRLSSFHLRDYESALRTWDIDKPNCRAIRAGMTPALKAAARRLLGHVSRQSAQVRLAADDLACLPPSWAKVFHAAWLPALLSGATSLVLRLPDIEWPGATISSRGRSAASVRQRPKGSDEGRLPSK